MQSSIIATCKAPVKYGNSPHTVNIHIHRAGHTIGTNPRQKKGLISMFTLHSIYFLFRQYKHIKHKSFRKSTVGTFKTVLEN